MKPPDMKHMALEHAADELMRDSQKWKKERNKVIRTLEKAAKRALGEQKKARKQERSDADEMGLGPDRGFKGGLVSQPRRPKRKRSRGDVRPKDEPMI